MLLGLLLPQPARATPPPPTPQERQCHAAGWARAVVPAAGLQRLVLWKAPPGMAAWPRGAIVVLHGGGGAHTHFCVANVPLIAPQVRFAEMALAQGFAVFLLDSSAEVRDNAGLPCGKVWDDEPRARENLDLPFVAQVLRQLLPALRPAGSRGEVFLAGHSSGGFMALRAAHRLGPLVTAFAPVASGSPYGWVRHCAPRPGGRRNVFGAGFDRDTQAQVTEPGACESPTQVGEQPWDGEPGTARPAYRQFHHLQDGILDASCVARAHRQLQAHGHAGPAPFVLQGGARGAWAHYWLDEYNVPVLQFFASALR